LWHFCLDWLHVVDYGVASHAIANVLFSIIFEALSSLPKDLAVNMVASAILEHKPTNGKASTAFELKYICTPRSPHADYPMMAHLGAAQVRGMVPVVLELAQQHLSGTRKGQHEIRLMTKLAACYKIMHESGSVFDAADSKTFTKAGQDFLDEYVYLAGHYENRLEDEKRYSIVPKFHYFYHLVQQAAWLNPKKCWCYGGEDVVGRASNLAHSCSRGVAPALVPCKMFEKYLVAMHCQWCADMAQ
jgi:hypothetical protein